jgi:hypothetical protein
MHVLNAIEEFFSFQKLKQKNFMLDLGPHPSNLITRNSDSMRHRIISACVYYMEAGHRRYFGIAMDRKNTSLYLKIRGRESL